MSKGGASEVGGSTGTGYTREFMARLKARNPAEPEFHQAVEEVVESLALVLDRHPEFKAAKILERMVEPERVIMFRVPWVDDQGEIQVNRGFRIQMNSRHRPVQGRPALPPLGQPGHPQVPGLRAGVQERPDHPAHGRRQGRLRLRPQGQERRRGHALLPELHERALPPHRPRHRRARRRHRRGRPRDRLPVRAVQAARATSSPACSPARASTGAARSSGRRPPATAASTSPPRCWPPAARPSRARPAWSPARGNVAQYATREAPRAGRQAGDRLRLQRLHLRRGRHRPPRSSPSSRSSRTCAAAASRSTPSKYPEAPSTLRSTRPADHSPQWDHQGRLRLPLRHPERDQRQGRAQPARERRLRWSAEGANMPTTPGGVNVFLDAGILYAPGKAANAGGVATSGLEMTQNSMRLGWPREEVDERLRQIMKSIHQACVEAAAAVRHPGQLRERGQHRRLPQGGQRHDGPGRGVADHRDVASGPMRRTSEQRRPAALRTGPAGLAPLLRLPAPHGPAGGEHHPGLEHSTTPSSCRRTGSSSELILGEFLDLNLHHTTGLHPRVHRRRGDRAGQGRRAAST